MLNAFCMLFGTSHLQFLVLNYKVRGCRDRRDTKNVCFVA